MPVHFILTAVDAGLQKIHFEIDTHTTILLPFSLEPGEHAKYGGGNSALVYDESWNKIREIPLNPEDFHLASGPHTLQFNCEFTAPGKELQAKIEFRLRDTAETVKKR